MLKKKRIGLKHFLKSAICFQALLFFFILSSSAQQNFNLSIHLQDTLHQSDFSKLEKDILSQKNFRDTSGILIQLKDALLFLQGNGYLAASFDSLTHEGVNYTAWLYLGNFFEWAKLSKGNVEDAFFSGSGFRTKLFEGKPFRYFQIRKIQEKILENCENSGYPFAEIKLDSISWKDNLLSAKLTLKKNRAVIIDSVVLRGKATIAPVYIYSYIGIRPGDVYDESRIEKISNRLRELPFVVENRPNRVVFTNKETKLELFLENKRASQFDGVIGLLPDDAKPGKFVLTGEAHLKLQNSLKRGEIIELNWKQLPGKTQDLKIHGLYPFILDTPLGLDAHLSLYKKDSTYVDVTRNLGVQYSFIGNDFIKAFVNDKESDLQSTRGLENITTLPPYADITILTYGLTFHYERVDYRLNPRKGLLLEVTGSTGNRTIRKNSSINPILYDSLKLKTTNYNGEIAIDYYISLGGRHVLNPGLQAAYLYNPEIFTNELFRIGGLRSLRGFDEESIYASTFTIGKLEYRYLLEQNSFLFAFFNAAWYENRNRSGFLTDTPFGFGAGIDFETKLGIMSVSYALGKQFDNPIYFRTGKIHFGIVNYF
ncbi:MAG: BamA/TamA family outer membrane protein [Bacteroidia bacterium]|nr:BamA/TamA family outer membrane protein [Bacteroidia bacterium]